MLTTMRKKANSNQTELSKLRNRIRLLHNKLFEAEQSLAKHDIAYQDKLDELDLTMRRKDAMIKELSGRLHDGHHTYRSKMEIYSEIPYRTAKRKRK